MCKGTETQNTNHGFKPLARKSDQHLIFPNSI